MLFCQVVFLTMISGFFGLHLTTKSTNRLFMQSSINSKSIAPIYKTDVASLKTQVLLMGAALDRGQAYNPTSGSYYSDKMAFAKSVVEELVKKGTKLPKSLSELDGEWELVLSTVPHGIFRSSPFFLAIQEAFNIGNEPEKANLFFKLHELQTCSWGVSKVGRIGQFIDSKEELYISEFDTSIFSLTVIPIIGWFKLLPTFGGRVITVSKAKIGNEPGLINLEVDYTTSKPVDGLSGLGSFIWKIKVPVGAVWRLLPWNKGRAPTCSIKIKYFDRDMRIMQDIDGEYYVYARPAYIEPV